MSGLLLALALSQAASGNDFQEEIRLLRAAGAFDLSRPARTCIRAGSEAYRPNANEIGRESAANNFVRRVLVQCDIDGTRSTIVAALRRAHGSLSRREAGRVAELEINVVRVEAEQLAERKFQLPPPPPPMLVPDRYPPTNPSDTQED